MCMKYILCMYGYCLVQYNSIEFVLFSGFGSIAIGSTGFLVPFCSLLFKMVSYTSKNYMVHSVQFSLRDACDVLLVSNAVRLPFTSRFSSCSHCYWSPATLKYFLEQASRVHFTVLTAHWSISEDLHRNITTAAAMAAEEKFTMSARIYSILQTN